MEELEKEILNIYTSIKKINEYLLYNFDRGDNMKNCNSDKKVLIFNKPFLGGWLNKEGNIGHEIIDFISTDNGELYVYNNPWGICPDNIWVEGTNENLLPRLNKEKYIAKYMVLTGKEVKGSFEILNVIELDEKIHRYHTVKKNNKRNNDDKNYINNQEKIRSIIKKREIKYNGKYLYDIYKRNDESLYFTFKAKKIYYAPEPILVDNIKYNFQRNKGYIYKDKNEKDYNTVENLINDSIKNNSLLPFKPKKLNKKELEEINNSKTFINLLQVEDSEQVYTNMLYHVLKYGRLINDFCVRFKCNKKFIKNDLYKVKKENITNEGRMDICAEGSKQRIIIENKINSNLNGKRDTDKKSQLSRYYKNWGKKDVCVDPLCFILIPDDRKRTIEKEILKDDPKMKDKYIIVTYGEIAKFIDYENKNKKIKKDFVYYSLIDQIITSFKNHSYLTKEHEYAAMFLEATENM